MSATETAPAKIGYTCSHCGATFTPFKLPPHDCAGVRADLAAAKIRMEPLPLPRLDRTPITVGDTVAWTERTGKGRHERKEGTVSHLLENGKVVLIRVGNSLVEKNMGQVTRVARAKKEGTR